MAVKDLPITNIPKFNGTIGDYINVTCNGDGIPTRVEINPNGAAVKVIDNVTDASDYLTNAMGLPFDYKFLDQGRHLQINLKTNIGPSRSAGVVLREGYYQLARADGSTLIPTGLPVLDTGERNRLTTHLVIDAMLKYKIVVDADQLAEELTEAQLNQVRGAMQALWEILNQPDIPSAHKYRQDKINARRQARADWRATRNQSQSPVFEKPAHLMGVVDDVDVDVYKLPAVRLYRLSAGGEPLKMSCYWDHSTLAIQWVKNSIDLGYKLATAPALKAAGLIN
jgi:hypothetical protein